MIDYKKAYITVAVDESCKEQHSECLGSKTQNLRSFSVIYSEEDFSNFLVKLEPHSDDICSYKMYVADFDSCLDDYILSQFVESPLGVAYESVVDNKGYLYIYEIDEVSEQVL